MRIKIDKEENIKKSMVDLEILLRERHDIMDPSGKSDDFTVRSAQQMLDALSTVTNALKYFLSAMAALSLVTGGIGVMNIMLINVAERTREIGLRKALGANNQHILSQFLMESLSVTFLGGIFGSVGGVSVSYLVMLVARLLDYQWNFILGLDAIAIAFTVSAAVGLVFGLYPAIRASRLSPMEALRYE